ncbi:MAG: Cas10/Cmr2 second palm domain-containing protein [Phycisphaerae bacterium]
MSQEYVSYDIRGIQQSIFAVPRLKYIVGGSSLIDEFDRATTDNLARSYGAQKIFCGGGRGLFKCDATRAAQLEQAIVKDVNALGLDVRIGHDVNLLKAVSGAERLYAVIPQGLDGEPCAASGLFPVNANNAQHGPAHGLEHPLISQRLDAANRDALGNRMLNSVRDSGGGLTVELLGRRGLEFMKNVNPDDNRDENGRLGHKALGEGNQWAVLVFDGNDIGKQHQAARATFRGNEPAHERWLQAMSTALDQCARDALAWGLCDAIAAWWADCKGEWKDEKNIVLPFRPLVAGGDDILLLAHPAYAMELVKSICRKFAELSKKAHEKVEGGLWLGTGGELSVSAGVVYAPTSFPLATVIAYAETLLAGAKTAGRGMAVLRTADGNPVKSPSPAMVDWEVITEGAIENPTARRRRELQFKDGDDNDRQVLLTCRPWMAKKLFDRREEVQKPLENIPRSIRHELMAGLRQPAWARLRMLARMKKNFSELYENLYLQPGTARAPGAWWHLEDGSNGRLRTDVVDMILLLEQESKAAASLEANR